MNNCSNSATIYGIDIGKTRFDVVCLNGAGQPISRSKFRRDTLLKYFSSVPKAIVAMESCPGSQWLARKLLALGHDARILPAQFVKPYVKSNKNDVRDAEAIAEAASRPTMRFV
jgi:transposase